jgi:asparagine synthase (glutamine-hydrolysing)
MADASIIPTYLLARFTRQHVKVALGGDGGDELLAGYPTLVAHRLARFYAKLPSALSDRLVPSAVHRLPVSVDNLSFDFKARRFVDGARLPLVDRHVRWMGSFRRGAVANLLAPELAAALSEASAERSMAASLAAQALREPLNQVLYLDMKLYLENDILVKLDRATMMASLEARVPLLNVDFVEHVSRLPIDLKLRGLRSKWILKQALRGILPAEIVDRPKKGFGIPVARWFRGPLKELLLDTLNRDAVRRHGLFRWEPIQALLQEHLDGRADHRKELWTLFIFQRWHDAWVTDATRSRTTA